MNTHQEQVSWNTCVQLWYISETDICNINQDELAIEY